MPALIACATGVVKVVSVGRALITVVAIPFAFAAIAVLMAATMSDARELAEPVHLGVGRPSRAAASLNPYCVGTKNRSWSRG